MGEWRIRAKDGTGRGQEGKEALVSLEGRGVRDGSGW